MSADGTDGEASGADTLTVGGTYPCQDVMPKESELPSYAGNNVGFGVHASFASARPMENALDSSDTVPDVVSLVVDISGETAAPLRDGSAIQTGDVAFWELSESPVPTSGECTILDDSPEVTFGANQGDGRVTSFGAVWELRTDALHDLWLEDDPSAIVVEIRSEVGEAAVQFDTGGRSVTAAAHNCATQDEPPMWC